MSTAAQSPARSRYRTIDLIVPVIIGVVFGVAFYAYGGVYTVLTPLFTAFPPASGLPVGFFVVPAIVAALIVRKPGAALIAEMLAAVIEMALGSQFGWIALMGGVVKVLSVEGAFLLFRWKKFTYGVALLGAVMSLILDWLFKIILVTPEWSAFWKGSLLVAHMISAPILSAGVAVLLVSLLAKTGAINAFAPGREASRAHAS